MASRDLIQVNMYAAARAAAGVSSVEVPPGTLADVLVAAIAGTRPELADVIERCSFLIDGLAAHDAPSTIDLTGGQQVDVLPPFAGG